MRRGRFDTRPATSGITPKDASDELYYIDNNKQPFFEPTTELLIGTISPAGYRRRRRQLRISPSCKARSSRNRVNNVRTDFDLDPPDDADADQPTLFHEDIRRSEIRDACLQQVQSDLSNIIQDINAAKEERIWQYVQTEAPQYKILMKYRSEFIDKIPPNATKPVIEAALHRELFEREQRLKVEGSRIIREAVKVDDYEEYHQRLADFMDKYNELGISALAQYVKSTENLLDLLARALSQDGGTGKYPLEKAVHHLIFPMRETSDDLPYYQQNLWLIDERLTYHSFIASDKPLASLGDALHSPSMKRPDLVIFDRKIAFAEGEQPINSIIVVEFKRPQRDDYKVDDNPLAQAFDMITEVRSGQCKDRKGRPISVANDKDPASATSSAYDPVSS